VSAHPKRGASFVVWLEPGNAPACVGRVEDVATSRRRRFGSAEQLLAFLFECREQAPEPRDEPGDDAAGSV